MNTKQTIENLGSLIQACVSPYHCILESSSRLVREGFQELTLHDSWNLSPGMAYYIKAFDSTLVAFTIGSQIGANPSLRIAASHTDWPCLKVKPNPEVTQGRYGKLNIEVYGGPILNTWLDRPLSMAGKVCIRGKAAFSPITKFIDMKRPLLTVPNLAIHMNRDVNQGVPLNAQIDMLPLLTLITSQLNKDDFFLELLAKETNVSKEDILDYEIYIYNTDSCSSLGLNEEFFSAPRLDNLTSVQSCLAGITQGRRETGINLIALYDNEEIGSKTKQGAQSLLLERILEKIFISLGYSREILLNSLLDGFFLSVDVAHAIHPNHPEKCDIKNQILLNDGVCLKMAANQAYATDASSVAIIEALCRENHIPHKKFSNRSDAKGGSTLGSISSAALTMKAVDIGVPLLAMHSAREVMGMEDQAALEQLVTCFFCAE